MSLPSYQTGTVSVAANGTVVTGSGTIWSGINVRAGDTIYIDGLDGVEIKDVTDATHLTLWSPWLGGAKTSRPYVIVQNYPARVTGVAAAEDVGTMIAKLKTDGLPFLLGTDETVPDPSLGADGQYYEDPLTGRRWFKVGGVWTLLGVFKPFGLPSPWSSATAYNTFDTATLNGTSYVCILAHTNHTPPNATYWAVLASKGDTGASYAGTSTTSLAIGTGSKTLTTQAGLAYLPGARARAVSIGTNLLLWSEDFSNVVWSAAQVTVTVNAIAAPDGTTTADKIVVDTSTGAHSIYQDVAKAASAVTYSVSCYLKAAELTKAMLVLVDASTGYAFSTMDLTAGTASAASASVFTSASASIVALPNGWYRCVLTATSSTITTIRMQVYLLDASGNQSFSGNGTDGIYFGGAQLEPGSLPSVYTPTTTAAVIANASNWMEGPVASYSGTSLGINVDKISGSGTIASWNIGIAGQFGIDGTNGTNGATGASYAATSTTSFTIGTGSKAFTTQAGLAYVVGSRVRVASAANTANYMEGPCTAYSGTTLTINVGRVGGSGTLADWNLSIAGDPGAGDLSSAANLSDLANVATARNNLGAAPASVTPYLGQVATRSFAPRKFSSTNKQLMSRSRHRAAQAITSLQIAIPNWHCDFDIGGVLGETATGATATVTASIEYPAGTFTQIKFAGSASGSITNGATLLSDALTVVIPENTFFFVRMYYTNTAGIPYEDRGGDDANGEAMTYAVSGVTDQTMSGTVVQTTAGYRTGPCAIVAMTQKPTIMLLGASNVYGSTDTHDDTSGDLGSVARSIGPSLAYINISQRGDLANYFVNNGHTQRVALAAYCSHVVVSLGRNDLNLGGPTNIGGANRTAAQTMADLQTLYAYFPTKKIYQVTQEPTSSSTDAWATTTNQTVDGSNAQRLLLNTAIRAVPSPLVNFIEVSRLYENVPDSGIWKAPGWTIDGVHGNVVAQVFVRNSKTVDPAVISQSPAAIQKNRRVAFTPILQFGGASVGITYSVQLGNCQICDGFAIVEMQVALTSKGSSTGSATIVGLPFAPLGSATPTFQANSLAAGSVTEIIGSVISSAVLLQRYSAGARIDLTDADFTNSTNLRISVLCLTA